MSTIEKVEKMEQLYSEMESEAAGKIFKRYTLENIKRSLSIEEIVGICLMSSGWQFLQGVNFLCDQDIANYYGRCILNNDFEDRIPSRLSQLIEDAKGMADILRSGINREMLQEVLELWNKEKVYRAPLEYMYDKALIY